MSRLSSACGNCRTVCRQGARHPSTLTTRSDSPAFCPRLSARDDRDCRRRPCRACALTIKMGTRTIWTQTWRVVSPALTPWAMRPPPDVPHVDLIVVRERIDQPTIRLRVGRRPRQLLLYISISRQPSSDRNRKSRLRQHRAMQGSTLIAYAATARRLPVSLSRGATPALSGCCPVVGSSRSSIADTGWLRRDEERSVGGGDSQYILFRYIKLFPVATNRTSSTCAVCDGSPEQLLGVVARRSSAVRGVVEHSENVRVRR